MWRELQFEVFGACNRRCPYCVAAGNGWLDGLPDHAAFERVVSEVRRRAPDADNCALVGGEPSFWPYALQARFIATMRSAYRNWTVFTNGHDMGAPILSVPGWTYKLHAFGAEDVPPGLPPNWRVVTVESPVSGAENYVDSGRCRDSAPEWVEEARRGCRRYRVARFDVVHGVVYPCCKSARCVPYGDYVMWQEPACDDCVPFGADTVEAWALQAESHAQVRRNAELQPVRDGGKSRV